MIDQVSPQSLAGTPGLLSVEDAKRLSPERVIDLFMSHLNPGQMHFLRLLGFHRVIVDQAEGMYYFTRDAQKILDFFGGFGSLGLGHNHPRVLAARQRFQQEKRHEIAMAFPSQYAAALAYNLAKVSPTDLDMVFLGSSGTEAMEAAIKVAEQAQGPQRNKVLYAENSFHGKTKGALSITDGSLYRSEFVLVENAVRVPFGNIGAIERALEADPAIGTVVLETIQGGGGVISAPLQFWQELRALCDRCSVLWVADEVQCGFGRTGRFYAFEHAGVSPDIIAIAKSLGGGKCAMGAMIAHRDVFMRAYGSPKKALIHGPATFSGIGEACCTAIEAINVLYDEGLMENASLQGKYLLAQLASLKEKHHVLIKDVRGSGLMVGVELADVSQTLPVGLRQIASTLDERLQGSLAALLGALLLRKHGVLVGFTEYNRNVIRLEPPLICQRVHIDLLIEAIDDVLSRGLSGILSDYARHVRFRS
jgi:acetylornithine/succinyldiaminopimelate/putrescine aminotransferase